MNYNLRSGKGQIKETILLLTVFPTLCIFVAKNNFDNLLKIASSNGKLFIFPKNVKVGNTDKGTKGSIVKKFQWRILPLRKHVKFHSILCIVSIPHF